MNNLSFRLIQVKETHKSKRETQQCESMSRISERDSRQKEKKNPKVTQNHTWKTLTQFNPKFESEIELN